MKSPQKHMALFLKNIYIYNIFCVFLRSGKNIVLVSIENLQTSVQMQVQYSSLKTACIPYGDANAIYMEMCSKLMFSLMSPLGKEICDLGSFMEFAHYLLNYGYSILFIVWASYKA